MTDQEVLTAIRQRMSGIEGQLLVDPPVTPAQFAAAVTEYALETIPAFKPKPTPAAPEAPPEPTAAGVSEARDALARLGKAVDSLSQSHSETAAAAPAAPSEAASADPRSTATRRT